MKLGFSHVAPLYAGVKITESVHATAEPSARPHTDDMREMVDHLRALGLVRKKPAAFQTPYGLIVHPEIMRQMRARLAQQTDDALVNAMTGAFR